MSINKNVLWHNNKFISVSLFSAFSTIVKILSAFVVSKVVAIYIGPKGLSIMGQLTSFIAILIPLSTGGVLLGVTKYIAEFAGENNTRKLNDLLKTSLIIVLVFSVICSLVVVVFSVYFSQWLFATTDYHWIIKLLGFVIISSALNGWILAVINGYKKFKVFNLINIIGSIFGLIITVFCAVNYSVYGALIALVISQSVVFVVSLFYVLWFKIIEIKLVFALNKQIVKALIGFSLMALISVITVPMVQLLLRNYIIKNIGLSDAGLWEAINRISTLHLMLITTSLITYYLPRLSEIKKGNLLREEVRSVSKIVIPFVFISSMLIYLLRNLAIQILFTSEFNTIEPLFFYQMLGDFFKVISWLFALIMLAKAKQSVYIVSEIVFASLFYFLSIAFVTKYGVIGATYSYAITYFIYALFSLFFFMNFTLKLDKQV